MVIKFEIFKINNCGSLKGEKQVTRDCFKGSITGERKMEIDLERSNCDVVCLFVASCHKHISGRFNLCHCLLEIEMK